ARSSWGGKSAHALHPIDSRPNSPAVVSRAATTAWSACDSTFRASLGNRSIGVCVARSTDSATEPRTTRRRPLRPWVLITIKSTPRTRAASAIASAGWLYHTDVMTRYALVPCSGGHDFQILLGLADDANLSVSRIDTWQSRRLGGAQEDEGRVGTVSEQIDRC